MTSLESFVSGSGRPLMLNGSAPAVAAVLAGIAVVVLVSGISGSGLSVYAMNMIGQAAAFGLLAIALDLVWGFGGILSLGHGLYFAIGGYLIAMHMVKVAFLATGTPPDFMLFMGWEDLPVYYALMENIYYIVGLIIVVAVLVSAIFGAISFRSRVTGVYFAIITQALVYVAMLLFFRNDTGFGGNNGMTGFVSIFGSSLSDPVVVAVLCASTIMIAAIAIFGLNILVRSRFGHMLMAIRDDEPRLRFLGYETIWVKLLAWCLSAVLAAIAGALYVPQVGIINPRVLSPELSVEIAVWVIVGGRGTLVGAFLGAVAITALKFWLTAFVPDLWPFILSALVLAVVVFLPNGVYGTPEVFKTGLSRAKMLGGRKI